MVNPEQVSRHAKSIFGELPKDVIDAVSMTRMDFFEWKTDLLLSDIPPVSVFVRRTTPL